MWVVQTERRTIQMVSMWVQIPPHTLQTKRRVSRMPVLTLCGSMKSLEHINKVEKELKDFGYVVHRPTRFDYHKIKDENKFLRIKQNLIREHFKLIHGSDAILVCNKERNGYIGANTLIEIGHAFSNNKQIFLEHPTDIEEIRAMDIRVLDVIDSIREILPPYMGWYNMDELSIEVTYKCDQKCIFCSSSATSNGLKKELTDDQIYKMIEQAKENGCRQISFSGGEPLLHPNIFNFLKRCKDLNLKTLLYTSGIFKDGDRYICISPEALDGLEELVDKMIFSIESYKDNIHDELTGVKGSLDILRNNILHCVTRNMYVECHLVPMTTNYRDIPETTKMLEDSGVDRISILRYVPQGRGKLNKDKLLLSKSQFLELQHMLLHIMKDKTRTIEMRLGDPVDFLFLLDSQFKPRHCPLGKDRLCVTPEGDVHFCAACKNLNKYACGNINKTTIEDIWFNSPILEFFRTFDPNKLNGQCTDCKFKLTCQGKCVSQRLLYFDDYYEGDPLCPRELIETEKVFEKTYLPQRSSNDV